MPYLMITAKIENEKTGVKSFIDLVPHLSLGGNLHYARNIALPGSVSDLYRIEFKITPPTLSEVALHTDWAEQYGEKMMEGITFEYKKVSFEAVAAMEH